MCLLQVKLLLSYETEIEACLRHAGSVTPLPQPGNPKPRVFRLPELECAMVTNVRAIMLQRYLECMRERGYHCAAHYAGERLCVPQLAVLHNNTVPARCVHGTITAVSGGSYKQWRLLCSAVINRYGFNSDGVDAVAANMAGFRRREAAGLGLGLGSSQTPAAPADAAAPSGRVGVNLGKNKARPLCRRELHP